VWHSGSPAQPGDLLRTLADEVAKPIESYRALPAWRVRCLQALSNAPAGLSLWTTRFEAASQELSLPDPALAESWDVWQFEEAVREAAAVLVAAAVALDEQYARFHPVTPATLRSTIADTLAVHVKAYDLAEVCIGLGLDPCREGENPFSSKRAYVQSRLLRKMGDDLARIAQAVVDEYGDAELTEMLTRWSAERGLAASPGAVAAGEGLAHLADWDSVRRSWQASLDRVTSDPEGAITQARTMLESVCKHICDERGITYEAAWDLGKLYKTTATAMAIAPDQHSEQVIKQILSGVTTVVGGLAALRNSMSDAHGRGKRAYKAAPRHAKLAVNAAFAAAGFLIDTHVEKAVPKDA
jgi:hypothetical protein